MHHIITDGWSMGDLAAELSALYGAALRGEEASLPPLPVQYADFAVWQRDSLASGALDEHLDYWRQPAGRRRAAGFAGRPAPAPRCDATAGAAAVVYRPGRVTQRLREVLARGGTARCS